MPNPRSIWRPIVTCEHAGNDLPAEYRPLFDGWDDALASHRGWDPGTKELAQALSAALDAPLCVATMSRLLVDLNRSETHPRLFSAATKKLDAAERQRLLDTWYRPHRRRVSEMVETALETGGRVLHLAIHSFTPVLDGQVLDGQVLDGKARTTDIGLLYDPARPLERAWCSDLAKRLRQARPDLRVHRNRPYLGVSDGLCTALRRRWLADRDTGDRYVGIELEINQRFPLAGGAAWQRLVDDLCREIAATLTASVDASSA